MAGNNDPNKKNITVCLGSSCFSRGNKANLEAIRRYIETNGLNAKVSFSGCLCRDNCGKGPVISVDDHMYEEVNLSRLEKILKEEFPC